MADGAHKSQVEPGFRFDNTYVRDLSGFSLDWKAAEAPSPKLLRLNDALALELGLDPEALSGATGAAIFSGNSVPEGAHPIAQAYAGHQFGGFSPQLGDGRALLLGEVIDRNGNRRDIALKGSGATPFARRGDGKATLGPVLREYLIGEAMYALGVPTTRALAAVTTGEMVQRERALLGAVLTRVAASHIRVGTFQFSAARQEVDKLRQLVAYTIARHYPTLSDSETPALSLLAAVAGAQAALIAQWMSIGFIHGVMNTDNMTVSGETIDYGPCAFMDAYDPATVFSSIDQQGRYAYGNQPAIGQWNLARFAEALLPLIDADTDQAIAMATEVLRAYSAQYDAHWLARMRAKLGLSTAEDGDSDLVNRLLTVMQEQEADFTLTFRRLSQAARGDTTAFRLQFAEPTAADGWLADWTTRTAREPLPAAERAALMDRVNPIVIPRNHKVEEALSAAVDDNNLGPFDALLAAITAPFDEVAGREAFVLPPPAGFSDGFRTFCGT
ncbi:MAG: YdiU family protein [Cereibacter sphaeroides]|uniref:Protein nucleotidyltransferase YdiU n=1 Tax=Cereibacter sphaeroides TaxID=1063 RepID=A0A2W5S9E1_CERSP|nr:MAG: YdiU family protein [Cereibacter sphaeroides]